MVKVLVCYLLLHFVDAILKVDVESTAINIRDTSTYEISAITEKVLSRDYSIQMKIPSSVIQSSVQISCTCSDGQSPTCSYDASSQILQVANCFTEVGSDEQQFTLKLNNVKNPDYAVDVVISDFYIMRGNSLIESYSDDIRISILPKGMLAASAMAGSSVVGADTEWTFTLRTNYEIPTNGYVVIKFPSYFNGLASSCNDSVAKCYYCTSSNSLRCIGMQGITLSGSCSCDKGIITVGVTSASAGSDMSFKVSNISNPPSTRTMNTLSIDTTNSSSNRVETAENLSVTMTIPSAITVNVFRPQSTSSKVGDITIYQLRFTSSTIIYPDSNLKFEISIPSEIEAQGYLRTLSNSIGFQSTITYTASYNPTKIIISNSLDSNVKEPYIYSLTITSLKNPGSTKESSTISITVKSDTYLIAQSANSFTVQVSAGSLTSPLVTPNSQVINTPTFYTFTFTISNKIPYDGGIKITPPSSVTVSTRNNATLRNATGVSRDAVINVTGNVIMVSSLGGNDIQSGTIIVLVIDGILNPPTNADTGTFKFDTYADSGFLYMIDTVATPTVTGLVPGKLKSVNIAPNSLVTGDDTSYRFTIEIGNPIVVGGSIVIIAPSQVSIKNIVCSNIVGFIDTPVCTLSGNIVTISNGFNTNSLSSGVVSFEISTIRNPQTKETSSSFIIYTKLSSAFIDESDSTASTKVSMSTTHSLESVSITPSSNLVAATSNYFTFTIDPYNPLYISNSFILIYNPPELSFPSSPSCTSSNLLISSTSCQLFSTYLKVSLTLTENTSSPISFNILNMNNPLSTSPSNSFTIITYLTSGDTDYQIDSGSASVSVTVPDTLDINGVQALDFGVGKSTNYIITITNTMDIPGDGYIYIKFPTGMLVPDGVSCNTIRCTKIESNVVYVYPKPGYITAPGTIDITLNSIGNGVVSETRNVEISTRVASGGRIEEGFRSITFTCGDPCLTCQGTSVTCTSCRAESCCPYFWNNQCNSTCPPSKVDIDGSKTCVNCSSNCLTCLATVDSCTSCLEGGENPYLMGTTCVKECVEPKRIVYLNTCLENCPLAATIRIGDKCFNCAENCAKCEGTVDNCTECKAGSFYYNASCLSECPGLITVRDDTTKTCKPCTNNCKNCVGSESTCISCYEGYLLSGSSCVESCPSDSTDINGVCEKCSVECLTCKDSISYCTSCHNNTYKYNGKCVSKCPVGTTVLIDSECVPCFSTCETCNISPDICLSCPSGKSLYNNQCLQFCPDSLISYRGVCQSCDSSCNTCNISPTQCTSCSNGLVLYSGTCLTECPDSTTIPVNGVCTPCRLPCASCKNSVTECLTCTEEYAIYQKTCVLNCPEGYYKYLGICEKSSIEPGECAQGCTTELRENNVCNPECNFSACDYDNNMCAGNDENEEDTDYDEDIRVEDEPFVFTSSSVVSFAISLGSKLMYIEAVFHSSLIGMWGVVETGSWIGLVAVVGSAENTHGRALLSDDDQIIAPFSLILILIACHYIMNISFLIVYYLRLYRIDEKHREWVSKNRKTMNFIYFLCGAASFKCIRISYSKMFNLPSLNAQFSKIKYIVRPLLIYTVIGILLISLPLLTIQFYILIEYSTGNLAWIIALDSFIITAANLAVSMYDIVYLINWVRKDRVNFQFHGVGIPFNSPLHTGLDGKIEKFVYDRDEKDEGYETDRSYPTQLKREEPEGEHFTADKAVGDHTFFIEETPNITQGNEKSDKTANIDITSVTKSPKKARKGYVGRRPKPRTKRHWFRRSHSISSQISDPPDIIIPVSLKTRELSTQKVELFDILAVPSKGNLGTEKGVGEVSFYGYDTSFKPQEVATDDEALDQLKGFTTESESESEACSLPIDKDRPPYLLETIPEESQLDITRAELDEYDPEAVKVSHIPSGADLVVKKTFVGGKVVDEDGNEIPERSPLRDSNYQLIRVNPNNVHEGTLRRPDSDTELRVVRNFDDSVVMDVKMPSASSWILGRAVLNEQDWDFSNAELDSTDCECVFVLHKPSGYRAKIHKTFLGASKVDPETGIPILAEGVVGDYEKATLEVDPANVHFGWLVNNGELVRAKRQFAGGRILELYPPELTPKASGEFSMRSTDSVEFFGIPRFGLTRNMNKTRYIFTKKLIDDDEQEPEAPPSKTSQASNSISPFHLPKTAVNNHRVSDSIRSSSRSSTRSMKGGVNIMKKQDSLRDLEKIYLQRLQVPGQPKAKKIRSTMYNPFMNHLDESSNTFSMFSEQGSTANLMNIRSGHDYDIEILRKKSMNL
jgi:hypothetical protein